MSGQKVSLRDSAWMREGDTWARGSAFCNGNLLDASELAESVSSDSPTEQILETVAAWNGFYSLVQRCDERLVLVSDQIRSRPLFYRNFGTSVTVSDDENEIVNSDDARDPLVTAEYALTGYVTGSDTLIRSINQVEAGQVVEIDTSDMSIEFYRHTNYLPNNSSQETSERELLNQYDDIIEAVCSRLIRYASGRPIVVSLSAGYDARMVATMLSRLGYDNTIGLVYRYGDLEEVSNGEEVAEALGIDTVALSQDHDEFSAWYCSEDRKEFDKATQSIDALPTIGSVIAFQKAAKKSIIPQDSVIVTGDSASSTGQIIPPSLVERRSVDIELLVREILDSLYTFWKYDEEVERRLRERIRTLVEANEGDSQNELIRAYERWNWRERQAKHLLRNHVFEFYGFDWWLPLWDTEYMDFWDSVPVSQRYQRNLHESYVEQLFSEVSTNPSEGALETFQKPDGVISRVGSIVDGTILEKTAHKLHRKYIVITEYEGNPVLGIMSRDQFNQLKSGFHTPHSFRTLESLGEVSFCPRDDSDHPDNGVITWDWCLQE